ncbi:hypothetical protein N7462_000955 [Penicillium macrosclerotiorum]|uniref:uncharacterized protein n=1 Tax=Penicillium macrosclerotiorum TaxID=303699 RepID=UPI002546A3B1|nr:uncharacterized protein N7462_000955 [Penicillium macrosclerotiorum]KAJ5698950.1 hypothetical protein N7462_000955 [Penicillium macrosclerotiorum]
MEYTKEPYRKSLGQRGIINGTTYSLNHTPFAHYFGGVRYGLSSERWRRARPLPPDFTYKDQDGSSCCDGQSKVCPQRDFDGTFKESLWSEDCFQSNIWTPTGTPPAVGWPVIMFILDGGWLQAGTPNEFNPAALIGQAGLNAIVVMPAYRLGVFGFLYSAELEAEAKSTDTTTGNLGFWDQRLALEWVHTNIHLFGGDSANITLAGYSAGSYSVFHQLAYEFSLPDSHLIRRACMWSNGPGVQPKSPALAQHQFALLLAALFIPESLPAAEKLTRLRSLPARTLLEAALSIDMHQFRPTAESVFIAPDRIQNLASFARTLVARRIPLLIGECRDEPWLYAQWTAPKENTLAALRTRLLAEYPPHIVAGLVDIYFPGGTLPPQFVDWKQAFGAVYADMQVYRLERGLVKTIAECGGQELVFRYRVEYRLECVDRFMPPEAGVTHATDEAIWFWGNGYQVREEEGEAVERAFIGPFKNFVQGSVVEWGVGSVKSMRRLRADRGVDIWEDALWEDEDPVWMLVAGDGK